MTDRRYELVLEDGGWSIVDRWTGWVLTIGGIAQKGFEREEAEEVLRALFMIDYRKRQSASAPQVDEK